MDWIDSHCHLESWARRDQVEECLQRAREAGVREWITIGTSLEDWELYRQLAARHPGLHWTVGLHPGSVDETWEDQIKTIPSFFATDPVPLGIGEIGLDYFRLPKFPDEAAEVKSQQLRAFAAQLSLAYQLGCPVVIHSRNAFADCVQLIDRSGVDWNRVIFHCFSEGPDEMQQLRERGGWASFTGILSYKNAETIRQAALLQGLDKLILETDAPYLSPEPMRGKSNEPAYIPHLANACANLFGVTSEQVSQASLAATRRFFFSQL
jgi:TatD DNase family protein